MTSFLEQEIHQQGEVVSRLLTEQAETARQIAAAIRGFNPAFVHIAARGTSDNAARYAQYTLGALAGLPVALATPSLHTLYEAPPNLSRAVVIGVSQSGASTDVNRVLEDARSQGALTISLTNNAGSPLANAAHHHFDLSAGLERSVAATKTYTAELTALAMITAALVDQPELGAALTTLAAKVQETLARSAAVADWAARFTYIAHFVTIGRGYNYCTAFEISLKIQELCYITGQGFSEADFRHGPMALIEPGFPVIVAAPQGKPLPVLADFLERVKEKKGELLVISNDEAALAQSRHPMPIPSMPEWLSPICAVIPGQVFAMRLAAEKGYALDTPRSLRKVTITE
jgi:glucosamine--fructose-6-phosphate aminotransferase (isomerizing)